MNLIERLRARREALAQEQRDLHQLTVAENRDLTAEEQTRWTARSEEIATLETRTRELTEFEASEARAAEENRAVENAGVGGARVTERSFTYRRHGEHSFFMDAYRAWRGGDSEVVQRMARHQAEMRDAYRERGADIESRAGAVANWSGFVFPTYLTDEVALVARAGRPFANVIPGRDLPPTGMAVNIPRITTGGTTGVQAAEGNASSETDMDDTLLSVPVVVISGAQTVSFQVLDRGGMTEDIILEDLSADYETQLDGQLLNGSGSAGQHLGIRNVGSINAVTYTDATPTVAEFLSKLADAVQQINAGRFLPGTHIVMAPRRWGWIVAAVDTQNRPLVLPNAGNPMNAQGVGDPAAYGNVVGSVMGLPTVTDGNMLTNLGAGTNEDCVIVTRALDHRLWEEPGSPRYLAFDRRYSPVKKNLQDVAVVYGYSAFTAGRYPKATSIVSGTGLIAPTF